MQSFNCVDFTSTKPSDKSSSIEKTLNENQAHTVYIKEFITIVPPAIDTADDQEQCQKNSAIVIRILFAPESRPLYSLY